MVAGKQNESNLQKQGGGKTEKNLFYRNRRPGNRTNLIYRNRVAGKQLHQFSIDH